MRCLGWCGKKFRSKDRIRERFCGKCLEKKKEIRIGRAEDGHKSHFPAGG